MEKHSKELLELLIMMMIIYFIAALSTNANLPELLYKFGVIILYTITIIIAKFDSIYDIFMCYLFYLVIGIIGYIVIFK